jgi:hypothetical protein
MAIIIIGDDALEELRRELEKPRSEERERDGDRRDSSEEGSNALPCADMTCPCRVIRRR